MKDNRNEIYNIVSQNRLTMKNENRKNILFSNQKKSDNPTIATKNLCSLDT